VNHSPMKIYLIGMPGSGKSTLGHQLADELLLPFVDLDKEIEQHEGKSIPEIFAEKGEDHFRQVESRLLREWAASGKSFVLSTGGGAPCFFNGIEVINQTGLSIFLDVPVKELLRRMAQATDRPLLGTSDLSEKESRLLTLYENRISCYRQAKIILHEATLHSALEAIRLKK
jgi:shikimate kinase